MKQDVTVVRQQMSRSVQTGYHCEKCGVDTCTYDGSAPAVCMNCQTPNPVKKWQNIIITNVTTEKIVI